MASNDRYLEWETSVNPVRMECLVTRPVWRTRITKLMIALAYRYRDGMDPQLWNCVIDIEKAVEAKRNPAYLDEHFWLTASAEMKTDHNLIGLLACMDATNGSRLVSHSTVSRVVVPYYQQADLFRETFENPLLEHVPLWSRPDPEEAYEPAVPWLTPRVLSIAQGVYDNRNRYGIYDQDRILVLSDALEEDGCPAEVACPRCGGTGSVEDDGDGDGWICARTVPNPLLHHLRKVGQHCQVCHVVDKILGRFYS